MEQTDSELMKERYEGFMRDIPCPECDGTRLKPEILAVTLSAGKNAKSIAAVCELSIRECSTFLNDLTLGTREQAIAGQVLKEVQSRLGFLLDVGLDYLSLARAAGTLSGGEAQRIRLATQIGSGLVGSIGALKGKLHGGAPSHVSSMIDEIGTADNAEPWLRAKIEGGERLMGFGHRVYKTYDPRARALGEVAERLGSDDERLGLARHVEQTALRLLHEYKPDQRLYTNVEYYAAAVLETIELDPGLYTPTFAVSRTAGWTAHMLEQINFPRLIRPQVEYVGPMPAK